MGKSILISAALVVMLFSGCDAFRRLAGRPTSADIEAKRTEIALQAARRKQAYEDSLQKAEKMKADSLAVLDSLAAKKGSLLETSSMGGLVSSDLEHTYYIVIGSFMDNANAEYMGRQVQPYGYEAEMISFRNGYTAVGLCPSDDIVSAFRNLKKVQQEAFCPEDVWILVNK